ncbi:hypothetical protein BHQ20_28815 [Mycobacterium intermedium]|nr:hypothetical protein BHQ20_28815 [Mycobacterium intermedium]
MIAWYQTATLREQPSRCIHFGHHISTTHRLSDATSIIDKGDGGGIRNLHPKFSNPVQHQRHWQ